MTDLDLAALRRTAEAATPGPWVVATNKGARLIADASADYIDAFSPPTVIALLDRIATLTHLLNHASDESDELDEAVSAIADLHASLAAQQKVVEAATDLLETYPPISAITESTPEEWIEFHSAADELRRKVDALKAKEAGT